MKIIIERNRMLLVVLVLVLSMVMCFTSCGHNNSTKEADRLQEKEREEEETKEEVEEKKEQLQIRNLEGITLDDQEATLPYNIIMYDNSTEAFEKSVRIHLKEGEERKIYFSLTKSEDFSLDFIDRGVIVEKDAECDGCHHIDVLTVGDIQTFSLYLPMISNPSTVVYPIYNGNYGAGDDYRFIAFYLIPLDLSETEN